MGQDARQEPPADAVEPAEQLLTEFLDFVGPFALNPPPDEEILRSALDLLITALGEQYRDAQPALSGRNRTEALFIFGGALEVLAARPGQRLSRFVLAEHAVRLYLESLDPYSKYRTPDEVARFEEALSTPHSGIGMEIQEDSGKLLCFPFPDSSAEAAGIPLGGRLMTVDGVSVEGKSLFDLAGMIRGPEGTEVSLRIEQTFGRSRIHRVLRESLDPPMVLTDREMGNRLQIRLRKINDRSHGELNKIAGSGVDYSTITLDLRSCPGGDLEAAAAIADLFLPEGAPIGAALGPQVKERFTASGVQEIKPRSLVLLYNKGTASAAEFLIGALMSNRDTLRVSMQGEGATYGKAIAQEMRHLSSGGMIQLTTARLHLPDGNTWQDEGLEPGRFERQ